MKGSYEGIQDRHQEGRHHLEGEPRQGVRPQGVLRQGVPRQELLEVHDRQFYSRLRCERKNDGSLTQRDNL